MLNIFWFYFFLYCKSMVDFLNTKKFTNFYNISIKNTSIFQVFCKVGKKVKILKLCVLFKEGVIISL